VTTPEPPKPSEELGPWIGGDIDFVHEQPVLLEEIEIEDENGFSVRYSSDLPTLEEDFSRWIQEWQVWADLSKDDFEVQRVYSALLHAR
jgi:hypothetical protein